MMRGSKTIELDFDITYSKGGDLVDTRTIKLKAPGFDQLSVHTRMTSYVSKAVIAFTALAERFKSARPTLDDADPAIAPHVDVDQEQDVMALMAMALEPEQFDEFTRYVRRTLTSNARLASVGDDGKQPITDEVWMELDEKGGMDAVTGVMSDFVGFFFAALEKRQPRTNGAASSPTSPSPTKAGSALRPRAAIRSPN